MGRAFRVVKRTAHLTVQVAEKPLKIAMSAPSADGAPRGEVARRDRARRRARSGAEAGARDEDGEAVSSRSTRR